MARKEFEMSKEQMEELLDCSKPVPYMIFGGMAPPGPQEKANAFWKALGELMGFDFMTVAPLIGKPPEHFSAVEIVERRREMGIEEAPQIACLCGREHPDTVKPHNKNDHAGNCGCNECF